jgi:hypothetical protein
MDPPDADLLTENGINMAIFDDALQQSSSTIDATTLATLMPAPSKVAKSSAITSSPHDEITMTGTEEPAPKRKTKRKSIRNTRKKKTDDRMDVDEVASEKVASDKDAEGDTDDMAPE